MRRLAILAATALLVIGCAAPRTHLYNFSKSNVSQLQAMQDADRLRAVSGVEKVLPQVDSRGNATLQVYLAEENDFPGVRHAIEAMGYQIVAP